MNDQQRESLKRELRQAEYQGRINGAMNAEANRDARHRGNPGGVLIIFVVGVVLTLLLIKAFGVSGG